MHLGAERKRERGEDIRIGWKELQYSRERERGRGGNMFVWRMLGTYDVCVVCVTECFDRCVGL